MQCDKSSAVYIAITPSEEGKVVLTEARVMSCTLGDYSTRKCSTSIDMRLEDDVQVGCDIANQCRLGGNRPACA